MAIKTSFTFVGIDKLSGIAGKISNSVANVTDRFKKFEGQTGQTNKKLKDTGDILGKLKGKVTGLLAAYGGFQAVKGFITIGADFQDSLLDLSSITGSTGKDLKFLTDESLRMSKATGIAAKDVAVAFKIVASAKSELLEDLPSLRDVTEQVLLLSNAAGIDLATSGKVVTESLNQFGAAADQANRFVNVLAAGSKVGASEVADTGVAVVKSAVAAKMAKLSFEQLNSMIQVLSQNGVKAEVAGTGLKTMLLQLEKSGVKQITPSIVGLDNALMNLQNAKLTTSEMFKLFGAEAISIGDILINNASLVKAWTAAITGTNIAQEQADVRMGSFNKKMQMIRATIEGKLIDAFFRLEPFLTRQAESFAAWIDKLDEKKIKEFADFVLEIAEAMAILAKSTAELISNMSKLSKARTNANVVLDESGPMTRALIPFRNPMDYLKTITNYLSIGDAKAAELATDERSISGTFETKPQGIDVNINLGGNTNVVESVKTKATTSGLKVRTNME
jgi:TP901 family phage tail tape measure protein